MELNQSLTARLSMRSARPPAQDAIGSRRSSGPNRSTVLRYRAVSAVAICTATRG